MMNTFVKILIIAGFVGLSGCASIERMEEQVQPAGCYQRKILFPPLHMEERFVELPKEQCRWPKYNYVEYKHLERERAKLRAQGRP